MPIQLQTVAVGLTESIEQQIAKASRSARINLKVDSKGIDSLSNPLGKITGQADQFTKSMEAANARVLAFGASVGILSSVTQGFREMINATIEVEKKMADINSVLGGTSGQLEKFKKNIFEVAKDTGSSFSTVSDAALELSRQGLGAVEVMTRLKDAMILSRLSGMDAASSVEGLTAAVNSFSKEGVTSAEVLNKVSTAAAKYSVSERDLIEGFKRSASVAAQAGISIDELGGIITAVQEKTARGGAVIGNAFKTIFTRIQKPESLDALKSIGIAVTDAQGNIPSAIKLMEDLAGKINGLSDTKKLNIENIIAGGFQISPMIAALDDLSSETSTYRGTVEAMAKAQNEAYLRNIALNDTLSAAINKSAVSLKELGETLGKIGVTDSLKNILSFFNSFTEKIQEVLDGEGIGSNLARGLVKGIGNILSGPGIAIFIAIIAKLSINLIKFGAEGLKTFFGIGQAAKEVANVQNLITNALINNRQIQQDILSLEGNRVKQAQYFINLLQQQATLSKGAIALGGQLGAAVAMKNAQAAGNVASSASGYMPTVMAESNDIRKGVGGARPSDRPVVIPNFAFGGGKTGTMVAHTGEHIVPNYGGGSGSAIFNRDMVGRMGLPSGAQKIRGAGGFIPNFVDVENSSDYYKGFKIVSGARGDRALGNLKLLDDNQLDIIRKYQAEAGTVFYTKIGATGDFNPLREGLEEKKIATKDQINGIIDTLTGVQAQRNKKTLSSILTIDATKIGGLGVASISQVDSREAPISARETSFSGQERLKINEIMGGEEAGNAIKSIDMPNIQIKTLSDRKVGQKTNQEQFRKKILDNFTEPTYRLAADLGISMFPKDMQNIQKAFNKKDAYLFSDSVIGGIFESVVRTATKGVSELEAFNKFDSKAPFDFESKNDKDSKQFKDLFGFAEPLTKAEGKKTATQRSVSEVIGKSLRDPLISENIKKYVRVNQGIPRVASGYIPNFVDKNSNSYKLIRGRDFESRIFDFFGLPPAGSRNLDFPQGILSGVNARNKKEIGLQGSYGDVKLTDGKDNQTSLLGRLISEFNLFDSLKTSIFKKKNSTNVNLNSFNPSINEATLFHEGDPNSFYPKTIESSWASIRKANRDKPNFLSKFDPLIYGSSGELRSATKGSKVSATVFMDGIIDPKNKAAKGFIPNFVSKSRELGRGVQGAFYKLGEKDGTQVGVKKFFKDGPNKAVEMEWLIAEFISKYAKIPSVFGPKNLSTFEDSKRKLSIRKEVVSDPLAKTALGSQVSNAFGSSVLFNALGARGLSIGDLHGSNYTVNKNAENAINELKNYPQNPTGAFSILRSMASSGAKIGILDPGAARVSGIARDVIGKIIAGQPQQKNSASGFVPNFVSKEYVLSTLQRIKNGTSGFSKQEQETFLKKFGATGGTGKAISLQEVFDRLDSDISISPFINKAYSAAGATASTSQVFKEFEKQTKLNPTPLRNIVKGKGFIPNFAIDLTKPEGYAENQRKRSYKARTYRNASGKIGSLFKLLPELYFKDGVLGDGAQGAETNGIFDLFKGSIVQATEFAGSNTPKLVAEAAKYGLKISKGLQDRLSKLVVKGASKIKGYASGYIPNFADPLREAISREVGAGVNPSQVYVDQHSSLKSPMNPSGLMVANRRDEPLGGIQGINRARKEGANAQTYGAAGGFVPNFAAASTSSSPAPAPATRQDPAKSMSDTVGKLIILQTVATGLSGVFDEMGKKGERFGSSMSDLTTALMSMSMLSSMGKTSDQETSGKFETGYSAAIDISSMLGGSKNPDDISAAKALRSEATKGTGISGKVGSMVGGIESLGSIMSLLGKGSGLLGKVVGFLSKGLPIIGQVIFGFQALSAVFKAVFDIDLGEKVMQWGEKLGQSIGYLDTPLQKAAKKLNELGEANITNLSEGKTATGPELFGKIYNEAALQAARKKAEESGDKKAKGKTDEQLMKDITEANIKNITIELNKPEIAVAMNMLPKHLSDLYSTKGFEGLNTVANTYLGPTKPTGGRDDSKSLDSYKTGLLKVLTQTAIGSASKESRNELERAVKEKKPQEEIDLLKLKMAGEGKASMGAKYSEILNKIFTSDNKTEEERLKLSKEIYEISKKSNDKQIQIAAAETTNLEIAKLKLDNALKYRMALMDVPTALEAGLNIQKQFLSTSDAQKNSIEKELELRTRNKELIKSQIDAGKSLILDSATIAKSLDINADKEIKVEDYEKIKNAVNAYADALQNGKSASEAEQLIRQNVNSLFSDGTSIAEQLINKLHEQNSSLKDIFNIETRRLDINRKINSIAEAQNYILTIQNAQKQESLDADLRAIANAEKLNSVNDRMFKARAEGLKSITSKDVGDKIDVLVNNRERATAISSSANEQKKIFAELQKDLLKSVTDKKLSPDLNDKITKATSIQGLQFVAEEMAKAEKDANIAKLDSAFKTAEIALKTSYDARDITVEGAKTAAQAFLDTVSGFGTLNPKNPDAIDRGTAAPRTALNNLQSEYNQQRANLNASSSLSNEYTNKVKAAQDAFVNASNDLAARLAELDPAYKNAKKALEDNFTKSLLTFENNLSKREMGNLDLQTKKEIGSARLESKMKNPETYTGVFTQEGYLAKQHDLEMQKLRQEQDFQSKIDANTAAIELERKLYTLENITAIKDNSQVIKDLIQQIQEQAGKAMVEAGVTGNSADLEKNLSAPLKKYAGSFQSSGEKYRVDPKFLAAISELETGHGTSAAFTLGQNAMGISNKNGPTRQPSVEDSIDKMAKIIASFSGPYRNASTISQIGHIYAPSGAKNDINGTNKNWGANVSSIYRNKFGGNPMQAVKSIMGTEASDQFANIGDMAPKIQQAVADIQKMKVEYSKIPDIAMDAAGKMDLQGDAQKRVAGEIAKAVQQSQLRNEKDKQAIDFAEELYKIKLEENKAKSFGSGFSEGMRNLNLQTASFASDLGQKIPQMFSDNMAEAMEAIIMKGEDFGDSLRAAASSFLGEITKANIKNLAGQFTIGANDLGNTIGTLFKASGGAITGGSGNKDDVPAMLMGGEYVMNKKAVSKYGASFMNALNNGSLSGFADGGSVIRSRGFGSDVIDSANIGSQTGQGGYQMPGYYGSGAITGGKDLLAYARQSYTSGEKDIIGGVGNNAAYMNLDPESVRLTRFGRTHGPMAAAVKEAKGQAFGLYTQELEAEKQAAAEEKAKKKAFINSIKMALISGAVKTIGGSILSGVQSGISSAGKDVGFGGRMAAGFKGAYSGGKINGVQVGGLSNLFSGNFSLSQISNAKQLDAYMYGDGEESPFYKAVRGYSGPSTPLYKQLSNMPTKATGGSIPSRSGIDTVPAMLSGGEFIMNAGATQRIGANNLNAMNSGASTGNDSSAINEQLINKLDELIKTTKESSKAVTVNVATNNTQEASNTSSSQKSQQDQNLSRKIKEAVIRVLQEEKRLGGVLRRS